MSQQSGISCDSEQLAASRGTEEARYIKKREHRVLDGQQHEWHPEAESWPSPLQLPVFALSLTYKLKYTQTQTQQHLVIVEVKNASSKAEI